MAADVVTVVVVVDMRVPVETGQLRLLTANNFYINNTS